MRKLFLIVFLLMPSAAWAVCSGKCVQEVTASNVSISSGGTALTSITMGTGHALVLLMAAEGNSLATVTDNNSGSWTKATGLVSVNGNACSVDIWYALNHASGATVVTATMSTNTRVAGYDLVELSGIATSSAGDGSNNKDTASGSIQSGTITTTNANDYIIGVQSITASSDVTGNLTDYGSSGGSPTEISHFNTNGAGCYGGGGVQDVSATGTYGLQWANDGARPGAAGVAALKETAAAPSAKVSVIIGSGE